MTGIKKVGKKPKGHKVKDERPAEELPLRYLTELTNLYLVLLFIVYPLYVGKDFTDIGTAKGRFFHMITYYVTVFGVVRIPLFPILILIGVILLAIYAWKSRGTEEITKYKDILRLYVTDYFALAYLLISIVSCIFTPYRKYFMWGFPTWYMGLTCQIALVTIYFLVSRFWKWNEQAFILSMFALSLVMLLGIINYFKIDPLGFYYGFEDLKLRRSFISTIGQRTMYSGFVMTLFPLGVWIYMDAEDKKIKISSAVFLIIGFMTIIAENATSTIVGLFGMYVVLFQIAFIENKWMKSFLEVLLIMLLSWRVMGFLQTAFPERTEDMNLEKIMVFLCRGRAVWFLIILLIAAYGLFLWGEKKGFSISNYTVIRNVVIALVIIAIAGIVIYIPLNTLELLPETLRRGQDAGYRETYLVFRQNWGNTRGQMWISSVHTIAATLKDDPVRFLIGAGPDEFYEIVMHYCRDEMDSFFTRIVNCAHNEWLDRMINSGILGGTAYLGIFISAFHIIRKNLREHRELGAVLICIASYSAHNFFCYQRITCTPFIFAIIGAGLNIIRFGGRRSIA